MSDMSNLEDRPAWETSDLQSLRVLAQKWHREGKYLPALRAYDRLIDLGAADAGVWCETGNALMDVGEYAQAIDAFGRSLLLDDSSAEAHNNLARSLYRLGDVTAAVGHLKRSAEQSDSLNAWINLATIIPGCPQTGHAEVLRVRSMFVEKLAAASPRPVRPVVSWPPRGDRQQLRIGYVSSYFHSANYMKPVWGLIQHHDRRSFAIHLFNDGPSQQEMVGCELQAGDRVHPTAHLDNLELAELIARCEIDILVDLNAYSTPQRLALWLDAPAPATIAWFNAFATTALPGVQIIVGDRNTVRSDEQPFYTESVHKLPLSYLTFDVRHPAPPVVPPPCCTQGVFTFGSLVAQYKLTPPVLDAWAAILRGAPAARLVLANTALKSPQNREYVRQQFAQRGISADRLHLEGPAEHYAYLQYYDQIDVALDAFPYNGGTTTMEALWQGVPVLTFMGDRWASRTSASLILQTHLAQFVTDSTDSLVQRAVQLATSGRSPSQLAQWRRTMRQQLSDSVACDTRRLALEMEALYRQVDQQRTHLSKRDESHRLRTGQSEAEH